MSQFVCSSSEELLPTTVLTATPAQEWAASDALITIASLLLLLDLMWSVSVTGLEGPVDLEVGDDSGDGPDDSCYGDHETS